MVRRFFFWWHNLGFKLIFWVGITALLVIGALTYINLTTQREYLLAEVISRAQQLSDTIIRSLWYDMLHNYRDSLYHSIQTIGQQEGIERVRIFNKEGVIMFSSDNREIGRKVDMKAEACYACHAEDRPLERLDIPERTRIFGANSHRALGMINPIYNEPACYKAPCHVHPPEKKILGVLDVTLSLATADERIEGLKKRTLPLAALTIVAISTIIGLFIRRAIYRPVKELVEGTLLAHSGGQLILEDQSGKIQILSAQNIELPALPEGLIFPVLKRAQQMSFEEISAAAKDLAEKAKTGRLLPDDYVGNTFTVSNLGPYGVDDFTAIINQPDSAIIAVGQMKDRPVVIEGGIHVRPIMKLTISSDHRVVDGALAAQFMGRLKEILNQRHFDRRVEHLCRRYYQGPFGRPSITPGGYYRWLLVGHFDGPDSRYHGPLRPSSDSLAH